MDMTVTASQALRADLSAAIERTNKRARSSAFWMAMPLVAFLTVFFVLPIGDILWRSVYNPTLSEVLPHTTNALVSWNGRGNPPIRAYNALPQDLINAQSKDILGKAVTRLNIEMPGFRSMLIKAARSADQLSAPYAPAFGALDSRWGSRETWVKFKNAAEVYTLGFYLAALDLERNVDGQIIQKPQEDSIYVTLFLRTFVIAGLVTVLCLFIGYPLAFMMANTTPFWRNSMMVLVLLPFWTSVIVRTTAWIVLLQREGVVNDLAVASPFFAETERMDLIHNMTGTLIAMTHILLPFMILPIYSVMIAIPPHYVRAARSLGASAPGAFWQVYLPLSMPGVGAGVLLVFILAAGFYITPALVGGDSGQMIGNFISFHMNETLNWGLAAALSGLLLAGVLIMYFIFIRTIGLDRMRVA
ncbi:MAG TPA: ABC transporter permease [Alphaproteobacteria bacterium]|nr:ABC transporter permease [Alphaproteobacteria bacterium]HAJ46025.1 ABC transporter permease [Alphaproteobacteria bacterium]